MAVAICVCLFVASCTLAGGVTPILSSLSSPGKKLMRKTQETHELEVELKSGGTFKHTSTAQVSLSRGEFQFWGHVVKDGGASLLQQQQPLLQGPSTEPYSLAKGTKKASYSQWKQDLILLPILKQINKGFFVESGAIDGEIDSNTLYYEVNRGWTGLLVEPDPHYFPQIKTKHRKAYAFNGVLSPSGEPTTLQFNIGGEGLSAISKRGSYSVQAQPLHALLQAAGRSTVDFWSLDVEGSEGAVLKSTDFSKVEVGVLMIEMNKDEQNNKEIRDVMNKEGFKSIGHSKYISEVDKKEGILDHIFINPKYFQKRNLPVPTPETLAPEYRD